MSSFSPSTLLLALPPLSLPALALTCTPPDLVLLQLHRSHQYLRRRPPLALCVRYLRTLCPNTAVHELQCFHEDDWVSRRWHAHHRHFREVRSGLHNLWVQARLVYLIRAHRCFPFVLDHDECRFPQRRLPSPSAASEVACCSSKFPNPLEGPTIVECASVNSQCPHLPSSGTGWARERAFW